MGWRRTKSGGAEMPGFSQHRSHPRPMYSQKLETRDFRAVPSLEHFSRSHPHRSLVCPDAKGSPYQLPPFITKRCGILFCFVLFCFFLEYSKNERLYLGEFQWDRACVLRRDGAARAWVGSPWARRGHREGLGTQGHWPFLERSASQSYRSSYHRSLWFSCSDPAFSAVFRGEPSPHRRSAPSRDGHTCQQYSKTPRVLPSRRQETGAWICSGCLRSV